MPRIQPVDAQVLEDGHSELLATMRGIYGAEPSTFGVLARMPRVLDAVGRLSVAVMNEGTVPLELKWMVAHVASMAAGCRYCSAHTGFHAAGAADVDPEKVAAVWDFATDDRFSNAERAALTMALGAAQTPNVTTDEDFVELRRHFDDTEIAELVAVVALFGFFNRWNDTVDSDLEAAPFAFARSHVRLFESEDTPPD